MVVRGPALYGLLILQLPNLMKNDALWDVTSCGSCKNRLLELPSSGPQQPHGVTSKKTPFFIATTVKNSNLIYRISCPYALTYVYIQTKVPSRKLHVIFGKEFIFYKMKDS
jgi:hypothetical protein